MMTWGQLRFQLQTGAPGVSVDLLDEWLNTRYEQVLEAGDWLGAKAHASVVTEAAYQSASDTVTLTVDSTAVVGVGTAWTEDLEGKRFYRPGDTAIYTVDIVTAAGALTLDRPYEGKGSDAAGTVYAASAYVLMQHIYALPADLRAVVSLLDPITELPMVSFSQERLDEAAGPRTLIGDPRSYAVYDDTTETAPPVLHQVELYPPPRYARAIQLEYLRAAFGFDGENTDALPLPWVSSTVLLYGGRAEIAMYMAGQQPEKAGAFLSLAKGYELKFQEELARLLRIEHQQRRKKPVLRMASRFTRHRAYRTNRGRNNWGPGAGGPN